MALRGNLVKTWFEIYLNQRDKPDSIVVLLIVSQCRRMQFVVNTDLFGYNFIAALFFTMNLFCTTVFLLVANRLW